MSNHKNNGNDSFCTDLERDIEEIKCKLENKIASQFCCNKFDQELINTMNGIKNLYPVIIQCKSTNLIKQVIFSSGTQQKREYFGYKKTRLHTTATLKEDLNQLILMQQKCNKETD